METYSQLEHDEAVRRCALMLIISGYQVQARVEGWFEPPTYINGYRPDIIVHQGTECVIIEVKKAATDWPKISALEQYVDAHSDFRIKVITPDEVRNAHGKLDLHDAR